MPSEDRTVRRTDATQAKTTRPKPAETPAEAVETLRPLGITDRAILFAGE
ncbi:MAG: hypothetical protein ACFBWO_14795 [Paracoccaceae bacterium]